MGCFSFICKESNKPINSTSFSGDLVHLFLLEKGKVIEHMFGQYDSYGRVFHTDCQDSFLWKKDWSNICDLIFDDDKSSGIAAILDSEYIEDKFPTTRSKDDPEQGWGTGVADCSGPDGTQIKESFHKTFYKETTMYKLS